MSQIYQNSEISKKNKSKTKNARSSRSRAQLQRDIRQETIDLIVEMYEVCEAIRIENAQIEAEYNDDMGFDIPGDHIPGSLNHCSNADCNNHFFGLPGTVHNCGDCYNVTVIRVI